MHRIVIFFPLAGALIFTQDGAELIDVVFSKENYEYLTGASNSAANDFILSILISLGLDKLPRGQFGGLMVMLAAYGLAFGFGAHQVIRDRVIGPWMSTLAALMGAFGAMAVQARLMGPFLPGQILTPALTIVMGAALGLALAFLLKHLVGDEEAAAVSSARPGAAGDRLAAITRKRA